MYEEEGTENPLKLQMVGWRGTMSLRAYVPIHDAIHYLRLLGADCSKFGMYFFSRNIYQIYICRFKILFGIVISEKNKFKENRASAAAEELDNEICNDVNEADNNLKKNDTLETSNELKDDT